MLLLAAVAVLALRPLVLGQVTGADVNRLVIAAALAALFHFLNGIISRRAAREEQAERDKELALAKRLDALEAACEAETQQNRERLRDEIHARDLQRERDRSELERMRSDIQQLKSRIDELEELVGPHPSPRQVG